MTVLLFCDRIVDTYEVEIYRNNRNTFRIVYNDFRCGIFKNNYRYSDRVFSNIFLIYHVIYTYMYGISICFSYVVGTQCYLTFGNIIFYGTDIANDDILTLHFSFSNIYFDNCTIFKKQWDSCLVRNVVSLNLKTITEHNKNSISVLTSIFFHIQQI